MSLEDWEQYVAVKRMKTWTVEEREFVEALPPEEQDLIMELVVRLDVRPVEPGASGVGSPEGR